MRFMLGMAVGITIFTGLSGGLREDIATWAAMARQIFWNLVQGAMG